MAMHEEMGRSDDWYTPKYIFDALGCRFDLDAAAPWDRSGLHVPADNFISDHYLTREWYGFVWLNPPFGGRNSKSGGLNKMAIHGHGIALMPDRSSAPWWQEAARKCTVHLQVNGKIKFLRSKHPPAPWARKINKFMLNYLMSSSRTQLELMDGSPAGSPSTGTTLFGYGSVAADALLNAYTNKLGLVFKQFK